MKENMILSLDPSKTATGWVIYDVGGGRVVKTGCFSCSMDPEDKKEYDRKTEIYKQEQWMYVDFLTNLKVMYGFDKIVAEYPHGSQSSRASWALSMVNSTVATFGMLILGQPVESYIESDCKKAFFGRAKNVSKQQTMDAMTQIYAPLGYTPRKRGDSIVKYEHEAVCDALLVLDKYLNKDN